MTKILQGTKFPYLKDGRLADVIAGLQILGSYKWASREVSSWAAKLDEKVVVFE